MLKPFAEMRKIDVSKWAKDRDGFKYLPWARAIDLLYENGAEKVKYEVVKDENGCSLHHSDLTFTDKNGTTNRCYEVIVRLFIDGETYEETYPVMNGVTPIKDNLMSQQRVRTSVARAIVKCIATNTGLGFDLWLDGEEGENDSVEDITKHSIFACKERAQIAYTKLIKRGKSTKDIASALNKTEEEIRTLFTYYEQIDRFEKELSAL